MKVLLRLLFSCLFIFLSYVSTAQEKFLAYLSQDGSLTYRITANDFYFQISQSGNITEFGTLTSGSISYNVNGRVDKIGTTSISYNVYNKVDKIGSTNISYNVTGGVARIGSTNISYNVTDRINRFGGVNISFNVYDKVERIGASTISYNVYSKVERINDSEGIIIFRNTTNTIDE